MNATTYDQGEGGEVPEIQLQQYLVRVGSWRGKWILGVLERANRQGLEASRHHLVGLYYKSRLESTDVHLWTLQVKV